jgi:hypothetical protein
MTNLWGQLLVGTIYLTATVMFISAVWRKWYPALKNKLNPTLGGWLLVLLNASFGFVGHLVARYYLNTLTGVDPNNFPKALLAFTVPATAYIWLIFVIL